MKCYAIWNETKVCCGTGKPSAIMAVVAHTSEEAVLVGYPEAKINLDIECLADIRIKLLSCVNKIRHTRPQVLKNKAGLRLGAYARARGECDSCGMNKKLMLTEGKCICDFCYYEKYGI